MTIDSKSPSPDEVRLLMKANGLLWLKQTRGYDGGDLQIDLKNLEKNPALREAAFSAFWAAYFAEGAPPVLDETLIQRIRVLLEYGSTWLGVEQLQDVTFVRAHLAGLLTVCLIRPEWPTIENPTAVLALAEAWEAYDLWEKPDFGNHRPDYFGQKYFDSGDLFGFSWLLVSGITNAEYSIHLANNGYYEVAMDLCTSAAWLLCEASIEARLSFVDKDTKIHFKPYLPHSGKPFQIQQAVDIFEDIKIHTKDINFWSRMQAACNVLWSLGYFGLYDYFDDVRDSDGQIWRAAEYWISAETFSKVHQKFAESLVPIPPVDMREKKRIETRLERDFFQEFWGSLEEKTQEILVEAEFFWELDKIGNMANEIRRLLEIELPSFLEFLQPAIGRKDSHLVLTRIKEDLMSNRLVIASIDGLKIGHDEKQFLKKDLPAFLARVIEIRNYFDKQAQFEDRESDKYKGMINKAIAIHHELLGIGCEGLLPRLTKIKKKIVSHEAKRHT